MWLFKELFLGVAVLPVRGEHMSSGGSSHSLVHFVFGDPDAVLWDGVEEL